MAKTKFLGEVRGYTVGDDGRIWLTIDESEPSGHARQYVHDLVKDFNPSNGRHGFGAKDVPCAVKPGFASYRVTLTKDEAKEITLGSCVELELEVFYVRRVVFMRGNNGKAGRWAAIPEMIHEVVNIRPVTQQSANAPRPEQPAAPSGNSGGKK